MNFRGDFHELDALQISRGASQNLPQLYDNFEIDGPHGRHICFVLPVASVSVEQFLSGNGVAPFLRPHLVQLIVYNVLEALNGLHRNGIVHTGKSVYCPNIMNYSLKYKPPVKDVRADNILICDTWETTPIEPLEGTVLVRGKPMRALLSPQPIPPAWEWIDDKCQVELFSIYLNDLGSSESFFDHSNDSISILNVPSPLSEMAW